MDSIRPNGLTPEEAIVVNSVAEEYAWLAEHFPGFTLQLQLVCDVGGRPFDVMVVECADGAERKIFFDIGSFYGRGEAPIAANLGGIIGFSCGIVVGVAALLIYLLLADGTASEIPFVISAMVGGALGWHVGKRVGARAQPASR